MFPGFAILFVQSRVMKLLIVAFLACIALASCKSKTADQPGEARPNAELATLLEKYYEDYLELFPLDATAIGDTRYNDRLPISFTDSFRAELKNFCTNYLAEIKRFDTGKLNAKDKLSYQVLTYELQLNIDGLAFPGNYIPFNQFYALPLTMGQLGSGTGNQPFKTVKDYEDWIIRAKQFTPWSDSAIVYFQKGIDAGFVLPRSIIGKMIPQLEAIPSLRVENSLFYTPVTNMPAGFADTTKQRLRNAFTSLIKSDLEPAYRKLADFLKTTYFAKGSTTSGIGSLPGGDAYYAYLVRQNTTTSKSPEEIYQTGLREVNRIKGLMDSVKQSTGFKGDLPAFFEFMKTDKQFTPYRSPDEVLKAFGQIHQSMLPHVKNMFNRVPKTPFEIRQTEAFRAASASAEYFQGSPDGTRPGIFYVPILDARTFNTTSGMESLFLHEAIPGHHYQISLQQEDTSLPRFRRYGGNNAYVEGWALYCEALGKELGLYKDPYQYMGALGDEMHRAIRLVLDVAIHAKGMSREEAIQYMMDNEAISLQGATAEVERYMVIPGQALGYKIGALKIAELRHKYEKELGSSFNLAAFHDEVLRDGALPLDVLEQKLDRWAGSQENN
jgi:uncharacterized protein (DUF885 family)